MKIVFPQDFLPAGQSIPEGKMLIAMITLPSKKRIARFFVNREEYIAYVTKHRQEKGKCISVEVYLKEQIYWYQHHGISMHRDDGPRLISLNERDYTRDSLCKKCGCVVYESIEGELICESCWNGGDDPIDQDTLEMIFYQTHCPDCEKLSPRGQTHPACEQKFQEEQAQRERELNL